MRPFVLATMLVAAASVASASPATSNRNSYPLSTCVVSGETLGAHGEPYRHQAGDREVLLCCEACVEGFDADPAANLAALDRQIIDAQSAGYPLDTCVISGEPLGSMGDPVPLVLGNRMVQLCCASCADAAQADPAAAIAVLDAAVAAAQAEAYPAETCPVSGRPLDSMGDPYDYVYAGKLIRFCCAGCTDTFDANAVALTAKIYGDAPAPPAADDHKPSRGK